MKSPCPNNPNGKHKYTFIKNSMTRKFSHGPKGYVGHFKTVGVYKCECGEVHIGAARADQPGADLREHMKNTPPNPDRGIRITGVIVDELPP